MKHTYKLLLVMVAITFIAACKKSSSSSSSPIVGKWTIVSDTIRLYQGGSLSDVSADSLIMGDYYQFNSNGTGSFSEGGASDTFTWSITGNTLYGTNAAETIDGLAIPSEKSTATIKTLDAHNLYLFSTSTASVGNDSFPETEATHFTR